MQEQFHAQLMLSLYRSGRQADALAAYQDVRRVVADELGIDPSPELRLLHQRILTADDGLLPAPDGSPPDSAPVTAQPGSSSGLGDPVAAQRVVPRQLPAATRHFAGRAGALKALTELAAEAAETSQATVISVIDGTAGIGKTTLALHFAHQAAGRFPDGQLYVNLRGFDPAGPPVTPEEALRLLLDALSVPAARIPAGLDAQAGLYRSLLAGQRMLVLLDNARDVDQVRPLLPASPGCLVVVTSRNQLTSLVAAEGASPLTLDVLTDGEAHELLTRRLGAQRVADDPGAADELIQQCARLPLALSIAAARSASQPGLSLAALTADLGGARGRLDALDAGHAATNVRAVLSWSYRQLDAATARLFRLLGLHAGPDVSAAAAASLAGLPRDEARRRLGELSQANLLTEHAPGRFSCHDLLRTYAAELAQSEDSEAERHAATGRMLDHYLHTAYSATVLLAPTRRPVTLAALQPGVTPEHIAGTEQALAWYEAECQVLLAAVVRARDTSFDTHAWQIPWALSRFLDHKGRWHDWTATEEIALAAAKRLGDRAVQAGIHQRSGYVSARLGNYEEAHAHMRLALSIYAERGDRAGEGYVHNAFAIVLYHQGLESDALDQALEALEAFAGTDDQPGRALALNSAGWITPTSGITGSAALLRAGGRPARMTSAIGKAKRARWTASGMPISNSATTPNRWPATSAPSTCMARSVIAGAWPRLSGASATRTRPPRISGRPGPPGKRHSRSWMNCTIRTRPGSAPSSGRFSTPSRPPPTGGARNSRAACLGRAGGPPGLSHDGSRRGKGGSRDAARRPRSPGVRGAGAPGRNARPGGPDLAAWAPQGRGPVRRMGQGRGAVHRTPQVVWP